MKTTFFMIFFIFSSSVFAANKVAVVKLLRGEVDVLTIGKTTKLKVDDWVEQGSVIKTSEKSFVKLVFLDKSQMNLGPNSEMKIEKFSGKDSGVIDLVKGKIRSQVTKDYLQIKEKDKSKLFIKTQNAVMGVRGTDFIIATNGKSTSTILFEGEIVFNKLDNQRETSSSKLEEIVDRGVRMFPGEFSVMEPSRSMPTVPALLNIQQRDKLENNQDFNSDRAPSNSTQGETVKSVVPEGLSGKVVANDTSVLRKDSLPSSVDKTQVRPSQTSPEGYVKGDQIKPANGSFVHIDSGVIIPPGPGSVLDKNTNTFIPGHSNGKVGGDGNFIPPKDVRITNDGKIFVSVDVGGKVKVQEVERPIPVMTGQGTNLGKIKEAIDRNPALLNPKVPLKNDIINPNFSPGGAIGFSNDRLNGNGGITGINDPANAPAKVNTTIIVRPQ